MTVRRPIPDSIRKLVIKRANGRCEDCDGEVMKLADLVEQAKGDLEILAGVNRILKQNNFTPGQPVFHIDHIQPLVEGGTNKINNLRLLCVPCHKEWTKGLAHRRRTRGRMR